MSNVLRIATFNVENLDDRPDLLPTLETRARILRPQLHRLRADVICFQEIHGQGENPRTVEALKKLLKGTRYENYHMVYTKLKGRKSAFHQRNLVTISRFPIVASAQYHNDLIEPPHYRMVTANPKQPRAVKVGWERPILHTTHKLPDGRLLEVVNIHLKSKLPTDIPGAKVDGKRWMWKDGGSCGEGNFLSVMKRVGQALETRVLIDQIFDTDENALLVVCGDMNSDLDEAALRILRSPVEETGNGDLHPRVLIACETSVPEQARFSLYHHGKGYMYDHILASKELLAFYSKTEIHNEDLPDESIAFADDVKYPQADHAPVVAEFCFTC